MPKLLKGQVYRALRTAAIAYLPILLMGLVRRTLARQGGRPLSTETGPRMRARRDDNGAASEARG